MAEALVSFGVEKLWELLSRESGRLQGVHEQVDELKREMRTLQSLLKDADARKSESNIVRNFLEDVKDIVDDGEDIIESFILKGLKEKGIKKRVKRLSCFLVDRRKFASDIEGITKRISEVIARMQSFGIKIIDGGRSLSLQERQRVQRETRETFPDNSEMDLVGVEESVEELVGHLVENENIHVVSISGMGGIGKTTLARQVFHHDNIRRHFDGFAWVCVSQEFTRKDVWQRILQDLRPHDGGIEQMDERTLQRKLFQLLETSRYLIVLDDVWKTEDWDRIKAVFPHQRRGSKMIITSRNQGVGLHADPTCFAFRPRILTPEESWKLCVSIVFRNTHETEFRVDEELEGMGEKMVTYCGGLPLAVRVLGGLLAKKYTVSEWQRVYENIQTPILGKSVLDDNKLNSVYRVLSLSYEDLPVQLKHCFLYLAHFPEDRKINLKVLFNLWAAEGIITLSCDGETIQRSGEDYLEELERRNMVIAGKDYSSIGDGEGYCQMHDMMREICLSKAKEENFLQVMEVPTSTSTINVQTPSRARRLVVHNGNALHMVGHKKNQKCRSVMCFEVERNLWEQSAPDFRSLPLLRVLDLDNAKFKGGKLPSSIGELIHLRFLSLQDATVSHLPWSLRNLKRLIYLNLSVDMDVEVHVPNILKGMLELRYLGLPVYMDDKTKLELGDLVNLEYLGYFSTKHSSVTDLLRMTRLTDLDVHLTSECTSETLSSSLSQLKKLESFAILDLGVSRVVYQGADFVLDFIHLKELALGIHMPRFPDQYRLPTNLSRIALANCRMEEDPMPILEKLLHLKSVGLLWRCFIGKRMVCSKVGFPQLHYLQIFEQEELEEWIVEEGSMPCLRTLIIDNCKKLKELPEGLSHITSLKELEIKNMKREWTKKLVPGGEHYYKVQHIPSVQFFNCDDDE
uniref:Putative disease resistance RPP8-like protein 2 n=1 Tax=Noccaea caerulescens TaxID=107243 RepID=A0A1J3G1H7_NOCCA